MRNVFMALALGSVFWIGCGPRVDCDALKSRLSKCTEQLVWAVKPEARQQFQKAGPKAAAELKDTVEALREKLDKEVYRPCVAHKGRAKDAKQIAACLKEDNCEKFAKCFAKYLQGS